MPDQGTAVPLARRAAQGPNQERRPLRVSEVAELLDVHPATVYREIEAGRLRAIRVGSRRGALRIPRESFDAYVRLITVHTEAVA